MNQIKNIVFVLLCCLYCQGCYKELKLDLSKEENQIVINGLFNNQDPLSATVTKTFIFYEDVKIEELINADVAIYENGLFKENMLYQKKPGKDIGEFTASFFPKIGAAYRIEATASGMASANAIGQLPKGVDLTNLAVKYGGDNAFAFSFNLNDPVENNYYYLKMFFHGFEIDSLTQERIDKGPFVVEIPESALPKAQRYLRNGYIFKDDGLEGKEITISGIAKGGSPLLSSTVFGLGENKDHLKNIILDTTTLFIHLQTLSEDAYKFYSSNASPIQNDSDFLTESSAVYGNVENGLGVFAGIYISEVGVKVE